MFVTQHKYRFHQLETIANKQSIFNVYKYEKCKFKGAYLVLQSSKKLSKLFERSRTCRITEVSGACDSSDFDGNTILVGSNDIYYNRYVLFLDSEISNSVQMMKL